VAVNATKGPKPTSVTKLSKPQSNGTKEHKRSGTTQGTKETKPISTIKPSKAQSDETKRPKSGKFSSLEKQPFYQLLFI
jgi:hypothetical protein